MNIGAAIPFGRSLTYRFAFAGFWSAVAFAEIELPSPLNDWGTVKGLLLRHFQWWRDKDDMFNIDGTLTIGFTYPNMYMSEDYNSPQSVYWAMKSFLALGLTSSHPFWTAELRPLPEPVNSVQPNPAPMHIMCNQPNHHYLLSMGQFCPWPLKATQAKYGKFAYSSHFGFSVPTGSLIQQMAPDNTIAISKDGGDTWRVPQKINGDSLKLGQVKLRGLDGATELVPSLSSRWKPWVDADIEVLSYLISPSERWPDWYIRYHRITNTGTNEVSINAVQGGFAIQGRGDKVGEVLPMHGDVDSLTRTTAQGFPEGVLEGDEGVLICSNAGASGIVALLISTDSAQSDCCELQVNAEALKPDANTNLIWQRTLIPTIKLRTKVASQTVEFASAMFALARTSDRQDQYAYINISQLWQDVPVVRRQQGGVHPTKKCYFDLE